MQDTQTTQPTAEQNPESTLTSTEESAPKTYTTKQARDLMGISKSDMQRIYLRHGLIPNLRRARTGRIVLQEWQLDWLQILIGLRRSGFTVKELQKYTHLARKGIVTLPERKAVIETKRQQAWQELEAAQNKVDILTRKEEYLEGVLSGKIEPSSEWI